MYQPIRIIWDRGKYLNGYNLVCKKCEGYKTREIFEVNCSTSRKHRCKIKMITQPI